MKHVPGGITLVVVLAATVAAQLAREIKLLARQAWALFVPEQSVRPLEVLELCLPPRIVLCSIPEGGCTLSVTPSLDDGMSWA